jgi:homoserine kinase
MTAGKKTVTAFAPASVGNVAVGFDVLGHALEAIGDRVRLRPAKDREVVLEAVSGVVTDLPGVSSDNTALRSLVAIQNDFQIAVGARVSMEKGIPLGSGMGGSAASAAAAVTAGAEYWELDLTDSQRLHYALQGEAVASGSLHADNVAPSLFGGLVLCEGDEALSATRIPVPTGVVCVLVHPHLEVRTREARGMLSREVRLEDHVRQTMAIAGFIAGCYRDDVAMVGRCLRDFVIEPQRRDLVPGFLRVKGAALEAGALGASLSGSGPSIFAWCRAEHADGVRESMTRAFVDGGTECESWISAVDAPGARVEKID